ncbi:methyltransferase domain-containing protein [Streptomyces sp. NBC_01218]|uniref:class I SAM-dependent methyltransferase n=1 Tax=Streptomyces sp. NBC_01218 TaxID=2903780 RepID=UPI002E132DBE|nr:methyltransferase domain-containing protein [Streptomyces sp. NBC_01218]
MLDVEKSIGEIWTLYGRHQLGRTFDLPELEGWAWDVPQAGPGIDVFGDVAGLRVLDLGAGVGRHAARLAALGADVTAVDASPRSTSARSTATPRPPACAWCAPTPSTTYRKPPPTT